MTLRQVFCAAALLWLSAVPSHAAPAGAVSVGAQYDSTHVYVAQADLDAFTKSFAATFGGAPSKPVTTNIMPVPSSTTFQIVMTPVGTLSVFAFHTPVPYPFGSERTGYLVTDMTKAIAAARASGAEVLVEPFKDPIGLDAVIEWPGGVRTQLYWHFTAPSYPPLQSVPDNRVYVSRDRADAFVRDFLRFSHGRIVSDDRQADAGEIGRAGEFYRRIRIASGFGRMQVLVTDGHLPFPFGRELMGYQVDDLAATLAKAKAAGATVLSPAFAATDRSSAIVQFPGGYIAEIHALKTR
jgi:predicted enzyme related to lactoylglutathione lyase